MNRCIAVNNAMRRPAPTRQQRHSNRACLVLARVGQRPFISALDLSTVRTDLRCKNSRAQGKVSRAVWLFIISRGLSEWMTVRKRLRD